VQKDVSAITKPYILKVRLNGKNEWNEISSPMWILDLEKLAPPCGPLIPPR